MKIILDSILLTFLFQFAPFLAESPAIAQIRINPEQVNPPEVIEPTQELENIRKCQQLFEKYYERTGIPQGLAGKVIVQRGRDWTGWGEYFLRRDEKTRSVRDRKITTIYSTRLYPDGGNPFNYNFPSNALLSLNLIGTITYIEKYGEEGQTSYTITPTCSNNFIYGHFVIRGFKSFIVISPGEIRQYPI